MIHGESFWMIFAGASLLLKSHLLVGQAAHFGETSQHIPTLVSYIKLYKHYKPQVSNFLSPFLVGYFLYISIVFSMASLLLKLAEVQWRRVAVGGWRYSCSGQGRSGSERFGYPSGGRRFFPFRVLEIFIIIIIISNGSIILISCGLCGRLYFKSK